MEKILFISYYLLQHEVSERLRAHPPAHNALHGGEPRVVPALHPALLHEPRQVSLAQHRAHEIHAGERVDGYLSQAQLLLQTKKTNETIFNISIAAKIAKITTKKKNYFEIR